MTENKDIKVLVLMGGISTEREVSLRSGASVAAALEKAGFNTEKLDITYDNTDEIAKIKPDVAFIALHGKGGEDGSIQGLLEWLKIPYTGPGVCAGGICMNKIITKKIVKSAGIKTPKFLEFYAEDGFSYSAAATKIKEEIGLPAVIKASCQGSSIGVEIVKEEARLQDCLKEIAKYGDGILAEEYIDGTEITVPVMGNAQLEILPVIEILSENEFYDYESKYTKGMSRHLIPARIDEKTRALTEKAAKDAYRAVGCRGYSRIDFIVDKSGVPYFIEINTSPGMTDLSLFPDSARYAGIDFPSLTEKIVKLALEK